MNKQNYNPGKIWPIIKIAIGLIRKNPELLDNMDFLKATLKANIKELNDPKTCGNCSASMVEYIFEFDCLDALLLLSMGRALYGHMDTGLDFTEANKIHVSRLDTTLAIKCRTTQCSKLGLVAKFKGENGRQVPGMWVITKRGFEALKGNPVPKSVRVWRGKIEERHNETITLTEAFNSHKNKVEETIKKNKLPKSDYRKVFSSYRKEDWYHYGPTHQGKLI